MNIVVFLVGILLLVTSNANAVIVGYSRAAATSEILRPANDVSQSVGTSTGFTVSAGDNTTANHMALLADASDLTYVSTANDSEAEIVRRQASALTCTGGTLTIKARVKGSIVGDTLRLFLHDGTYRYTTPNPLISSTLTDYTEYSYTYSVNPNGNVAWTQSGVNAYNIGVRTETSTGTIYLSDIWLERSCD